MSLCLWRVCMSAAFRDAVPGVLVYSAILSLTAVSLTGRKKQSNKTSSYCYFIFLLVQFV